MPFRRPSADTAHGHGRALGGSPTPTSKVTVAGRDTKVLVADYAFGPHRMPYSTSQVLTHLSAGRGLLVLDGTGGETVLRYAAQPKATTLDGDPVEVTWDAARKDLRLNYTHGGTRTLRITGDGRELTVLITDRDGVATTWHLDAGASDVLVTGPELARTAHLTGTRLDLTGDTRRAGPLRVFAPAGADVLTWNASSSRSPTTGVRRGDGPPARDRRRPPQKRGALRSAARHP